MKNTKLYPAFVVEKDPEYYVGRAMILLFSVIGFIDVATSGALWVR